jgi:hypothetical protein
LSPLAFAVPWLSADWMSSDVARCPSVREVMTMTSSKFSVLERGETTMSK